MPLFAGPPVLLKCVEPPPPIDVSQIFIIAVIDIGCDLHIKEGVVVDNLTIMCNPETSRPFDCVKTTPNETNVMDVNDPTGTEITVKHQEV